MIKHDGYRLIVAHARAVFTRNGHDWSDRLEARSSPKVIFC